MKMTKTQIKILKSNNWSIEDRAISIDKRGIVYIDGILKWKIGRRGCKFVLAANGNWVRC